MLISKYTHIKAYPNIYVYLHGFFVFGCFYASISQIDINIIIMKYIVFMWYLG